MWIPKINRGWIDHIISLENYMKEASVNEEHNLYLFRSWRCMIPFGNMVSLQHQTKRQITRLYFKKILIDRSFQVCIGSTCQTHRLEECLKAAFCHFNIKINSITKELASDIYNPLYINDCSISYRSKYMHAIERKLQYSINKINKWAVRNSFKFSKIKTKGIHFCNHNDPTRQIEGKQIPFINKHKQLGIIFDKN